jgi:pyruvate dehydrogenase E1 component beta subunit
MDVMKYKEAIQQSMKVLEEDERIIFLGYNTQFGSQAYGTLAHTSSKKVIETPVAENLMVGLSIGLALTGFRPIVFFERHDFLLNSFDAIINHLDKMELLANISLPVIIRAVVGAKKPLYPGIQHTQDYSEILKKILSFNIYEPKSPNEILKIYEQIKTAQGPVLVIEQKDLYDSI